MLALVSVGPLVSSLTLPPLQRVSRQSWFQSRYAFFPSAEVLFPVYIIFHRDVEAGHRVVIPFRQTGPCMAIFWRGICRKNNTPVQSPSQKSTLRFYITNLSSMWLFKNELIDETPPSEFLLDYEWLFPEVICQVEVEDVPVVSCRRGGRPWPGHRHQRWRLGLRER